MFAGYDQVAPFIVASDDPWEMLEAHTAKMISEVPPECRPLALDEDGLEEFQERRFDFAMLVEFCELLGPTVLLTCPKVDPTNETDAKFLSDLCVKMMATDFQHCSRPAGSFTIASDSSLVFYDALLACYCAYFTLYDIEARGYVRSFCLAFVARSCSNLDQMLLAIERMFESMLYQLHQQNMRQFYRAVLCKWRSLTLMERLKRSGNFEEMEYAPAELIILNSTSELEIALALEQVHDILEECRQSPWYIDEMIDGDSSDCDWTPCSRPPIINVRAPKIVEGRTLKPWFVIAGVSETDFQTEVDCGLADVKQQLLNFNFYDDCSRGPLTFALLAPSIGAVRSNYGLDNDLIAASIAPGTQRGEEKASSPLAGRLVKSFVRSFGLDLTEITFGEYMMSPADTDRASMPNIRTMASDFRTVSFARSFSCNSAEDLPAPAHVDFRTSHAMLLSPLFVDTFGMLSAVPALHRMFAGNSPTAIHLCAAVLVGMHVLVVADQQSEAESIVAWLSVFLLRHQSAHVGWLREEATQGPRPRAFKRQSLLGLSPKVRKTLPPSIDKFAVVYEVSSKRYDGLRYAKGGLLWHMLPRRHNSPPQSALATASTIVELLFAFLRRAFRSLAMARGRKMPHPVVVPPVARGAKITDEKIVSSIAARVSESFAEERLPRIV